MMNDLALALNLVVLGFFLAVMPFLPKERTWVRSLVIIVVLGLWIRYMVWRVTATAPPDLSSGMGLFFFGRSVRRSIYVLQSDSLLVTLSRVSNRSHEADRYEKWLRRCPPNACLPWMSFCPPITKAGNWSSGG